MAADHIRSWRRHAWPAATRATLPSFSCDAGDDPVQWSLAVADQPIGRLIRVRAGRCCSADPTTPPACGPATSARDDVHRRRSADVARADRPVVDRRPALRPRPGVERAPPHCAAPCTSTMHRAARVRLARSCGARSSAEQLPRPTKAPQPLWGWGPIPPDLVALWQAYLARFASAHTCRFFKQTLKWTTPTRRLPAAADRWTSSWPTSSGAWPATGSSQRLAHLGSPANLPNTRRTVARTSHGPAVTTRQTFSCCQTHRLTC